MLGFRSLFHTTSSAAEEWLDVLNPFVLPYPLGALQEAQESHGASSYLLDACGSAARWIQLLYGSPDRGPGLTEETNVELKPRKSYLSTAVTTSGISDAADRSQKYTAEQQIQFH